MQFNDVFPPPISEHDGNHTLVIYLYNHPLPIQRYLHLNGNILPGVISGFKMSKTRPYYIDLGNTSGSCALLKEMSGETGYIRAIEW